MSLVRKAGYRHFFMKMYTIPPNMSEKEKIIGGILNLNQFFWVLGGLVLGGLVFACTFQLLGGTLALIVGFLFCLTGLPFALYKKNDLSLYRYLSLRRKFKNKTHKLPNKRKEMKF